MPAVGDWDRARPADTTLRPIEYVETRTACISRRRPSGGEQVLAANLELIVIVMGVEGGYNLRRLEGHLVLAAASGAPAMVALNKVEVCADWPARLAEVRAVAQRAFALSARDSVAPITEAICGRTVVLLGSSGAGKSTIANALQSEPRQPTPHAGVRLARPPYDESQYAHRTAGLGRADRHTGPAGTGAMGGTGLGRRRV
jgi:ribosome biogenesis GTPase / thiamine phosphate phosphatase